MAIDFEYHQLSLFTATIPYRRKARRNNRLNLGDGTGKLLPHEFAAFKAQAKRPGTAYAKRKPKDDNRSNLKD